MQIKLIFTRKAMHLASFCKGKGGWGGGWELASGLMGTKTYRLVYCAAGIKHFCNPATDGSELKQRRRRPQRERQLV